MASHNPYAPSKASLGAGAGNTTVSSEPTAWRDGRVLVTLQDSSLPPRCVRCNAPADLPTRMRTLYWVNPFLHLLLLISPLILVIVYYVVRKKAEVDPGLCELHKKRRTQGIIAAWVACLGGFGLVFAGVSADVPAFAVMGLLLLIAAIVIGIFAGRLVFAKKITPDEVRLGGVCRAYLDELPEYPR